MKKILTTIAFVSSLFISGSLFASASYTPYYNTYQNTPTSNSYIYTQGCYRYQYDRYTQITSLLGSICTTNNNYSYNYPSTNYSYNNGYNYNYGYNTQTYPSTYSYNYQTSYNTQPTSQYYTYSYNNGSWYPTNTWTQNGSNYGYNYNNYNYGNNYNNGYNTNYTYGNNYNNGYNYNYGYYYGY